MSTIRTLAPGDIDTAFTADIRRDVGPGAWTVVVMPGSGELFGTRRPVKVGGTIDGIPFEATLLPMGDGDHLVPIRAALRTKLGKSDGDAVTVHLTQRFN
jgi:Domain of unknown function (DUF1905)